MAGTRLLVHVSFLVPFVVWITITCWLSLRETKQPSNKSGSRQWIQRGIETLQRLELEIEASSSTEQRQPQPTTVTLVVADSQVIFWKSIVQKQQQQQFSGYNFAVQADKYGYLEALCNTRQYDDQQGRRRPSKLSPAVHVWVCEDYLNERDEARWIVANGTVIFVPSHMRQRAEEWQAMILNQYDHPEFDCDNSTTTDEESAQRDWRLTLAVEQGAGDNVNWKDWMNAIKERIATRKRSSLYVPPSLPQHFDVRFVSKEEEQVRPKRHESSGNETDAGPIVYYTLSKPDLLQSWSFVTQRQQRLSSPSRTDPWRTTLYIPSRRQDTTLPLRLEEEDETIMQDSSEILTAAVDDLEDGVDNVGWISMIAEQPVSTRNVNELTAQALQRMQEFYQMQVLSHSRQCRLDFVKTKESERSIVVLVDSDGSAPRFLTEHEQQQLLSPKSIRHLVKRALESGREATQQETNVDESSDVALSWWRVVESIEQAMVSRTRMIQSSIDEGDDVHRRVATAALADYQHARDRLRSFMKKTMMATVGEGDEPAPALVLDDFPMDQRIAILAPLLLPLLLPLLAGLVREVKRYRSLVNKRQ